MKQITFSLLVFLACSLRADSPRPLRAVYTYPSAALTTNHVFRLYLTTNPGLPMTNWTVVAVQGTTIIGTNAFTTNTLNFVANPGWNYLTITASNEFGESDFFQPAVIFNPPQVPTGLQVTK